MKNFVKKSFLLLAILTNNSFAQETSQETSIVVESIENNLNVPAPAKINSQRELLSKISAENKKNINSEEILAGYNLMYFQTKKDEKYSFNIISSFGDNIRFGGFWERYAIVNFSPQMYIQPADFISMYGNHNLSSFIPIEEIKTHFKTLALQSFTILAIDNSINFLFPINHWIPKVIGFAVKNIVINLFIKPGIKNSNKKSIPWIQDESYYYSVRITF